MRLISGSKVSGDTPKCDREAALRFLEKAFGHGEEIELINIDKFGANIVGIDEYNDNHGTEVTITQAKYMNNLVESNHGRIKDESGPCMGCIILECKDHLGWN